MTARMTIRTRPDLQVWFTADLHLGHGNIIRYCNRPFMTRAEAEKAKVDPRGKWRVSPETIDRHDQALIDAINARVAADDVLWIVGDFCWGELDDAQHYRDRIACRTVYLVWGNHDHSSIGNAFSDTFEQCMLTIDGQD